MVADEGTFNKFNGGAAVPVKPRGMSGPRGTSGQQLNKMLEKEGDHNKFEFEKTGELFVETGELLNLKNSVVFEGVPVGGAAKDGFLYYPSLYDRDTDHQNAADQMMCRSLSENTGGLTCTKRKKDFVSFNCAALGMHPPQCSSEHGGEGYVFIRSSMERAPAASDQVWSETAPAEAAVANAAAVDNPARLREKQMRSHYAWSASYA